MLLTSKQLKGVMKEIRTEDIEVDQVNDAVLTRWEDDDHAIDALRDILARMEKANGPVSVLDIVAFIQFVLTIKWYAEKADRDWADRLKLQRKKTVFCGKRRGCSQELLERGGSQARTLTKDLRASLSLKGTVRVHQSAAVKMALGFEPYFCRSYPTQCTSTPAASGWILKWRQSPAWRLSRRLMLSRSETLGDPSAPHLAVHCFKFPIPVHLRATQGRCYVPFGAAQCRETEVCANGNDPAQCDRPRASPSRVQSRRSGAGVSRTKIFEAIRYGALTARKSGKTTIIEPPELQRWIRSLPTRGRTPDAA